MKRYIKEVLFIGLLAISFGCDAKKTDTPSTASADPDRLLQEMSRKLAAPAQLSFKAARKLDPGLIEGRDIPENSQVIVSIARPGKIMAKFSSEDGVRYFYGDGDKVSLFDETMKLYATVPLKGTIDDVSAALDEKYGFTPPLIEFVVSDPHKKLREQIQSSSYKGQETVNGTECHHLSIVGKVADSELWISVKDQLPYRLIATFKDRENRPQLQVDFSDWNLDPKLDEKMFVFEPPKDAEKIAMVTSEEIKQAAAKADQK